MRAQMEFDARALIIGLALVAAVLVAGAVTVSAVHARAALREKESLEKELGSLQRLVGEAMSQCKNLDAILAFNREYKGWRTSRLAIGELLNNEAKSRPPFINQNRLVLQTSWIDGERIPALPYPPRARNIRLVLTEQIQGHHDWDEIAGYVARLASTNSLGAEFHGIRFSGFQESEALQSISPSRSLLLEGLTTERAIESGRSP